MPYEFRQLSTLVPSSRGLVLYRLLYVSIFVFCIITPILALPRDVYVLSQDIIEFFPTKKPSLASPLSGHSKQLPYAAFRWSPSRKAIGVE